MCHHLTIYVQLHAAIVLQNLDMLVRLLMACTLTVHCKLDPEVA